MDVTLLTSAAQSASGSGEPVSLVSTEGISHRFALLDLAVSAVTGTLVVIIETSKAGDVWRTVTTQASITGPIESQLVAYGLDAKVRVRWTLTGVGASATFGLSGVAHQVYATPTDFYRHASPAALYEGSSVTEPIIAEELLLATCTANGYLGAKYKLPLKAWGTDLVQAVCWIADYGLATTRGLNPEGESYTIFKDRRDAAMKWLRDVSQGNVAPQGIVDSADPVTPASSGGRAYVVTSPLRGF